MPDPIPARFSVTINVASGPPTVYVDAPSPGASISGTVNVTGWAIDNTSAIGTAISKVAISVDGTTMGTATYGTSPAGCV